MAIDAQHKQYKKYIDTWQKINDVVNQENLENYLIACLDEHRNESYQERAVFYAVASDTVRGQIGLMFNDEPQIILPKELEYLERNIDGRGNTLIQQAKRVARNVNKVSRCGLYTSYPVTKGEVSKADINAGYAVATIQQIAADRIINWQEQSFGSKVKLTLVVFKDVQSKMVDYELKETETLRELYLEDNVYKERIWVKQDDEWLPGDELIPTDKNGNPFDEIQFDFVGAENNDADCDIPNQLALVDLNIGHYRNSADYEDNVWWLGQSQSWMSGLTQSHIDLMKENKMRIGSRELIGVPSGERFEITAAPPNPEVKTAMNGKRQEMTSIGASQLQISGQAKTATQINSETEAKYSTLSMIANNVSDAYKSALKRAEMFMIGAASDEASININTDFVKPESDPQELLAIAAGWQTGSMPTSDYVRNMKILGKFDKNKPDEDYIEELNESKASDMPDLEVD